MIRGGGRRGVIGLVLVAACGSAHLVDVASIGPTAECPNGGVVVEQGSDDNDDGVLQADEIDSSEAICNGAAANAPLVDTSAEPSGANCAYGGTRVRTGVDADSDAVLDDEEVQRVVYVCNSAPGLSTLVSVESEQPGMNCELGGVVVRSGADVDHDGVLDASEVTSTSFICTGQVPVNEVVDGDFYLRNSFDQALLVGVRQINGDLYVMPDASLPDPIAPNLEQVASVRVYQSFQSLSLPRLAHVASFDVTSSASFVELDAPALLDTGSSGITITPASLTMLNVPSLATVNGKLTIDAPGLATLDVSSLTHVAGNLSFTRSALPTITAPQLANVGGALVITNDPSLAAVSFPALAGIGGDFALSDFALLTSLDLRSLATVQSIRLQNLPTLAESQFRIGAITQLRQLVLEGLSWTDIQPFATVSSASLVKLTNLSHATTLDLPQLQTANSIVIGSCSALTSLSGFNALQSVDFLRITSNPILATAGGFAALATVMYLSLAGNGFVTLTGFPALQTVGELHVDGNPSLTTVSAFPSLVTAKTIQMFWNTALTTVAGFQNLDSVTETYSALWIRGSPNLVTIGMPRLRSSSMLFDNSPLTSVSFPQLTDGNVNLLGSKLQDLSGLPVLRNGAVSMHGATELVSYILPTVETGGVFVDIAPKLTTIRVPNLVTGGLSLRAAPALVTLEAPSMQRITYFFIYEVQALKELRFPALQRTEAFQINWVEQLESIDMPAITQIDNASSQGINVGAFRIPACQIEDIIARAGYTGYAAYFASAPCLTIDRCRLSAPANATVGGNTPFDAVGRLRVLGLTDTTSATDASYALRAQIGRGSRGTSPLDSSWSWSAAAATVGWNDAPAVGFDEYRATLSLPAGSYDVAARFSGDGGRTWTYCDLDVAPGSDGSQDGYQIGNAGHVEVQ